YSAGRAATTGRTGAVFNLQPPGCRGSLNDRFVLPESQQKNLAELKRSFLDPALKQINEKTPLLAKYSIDDSGKFLFSIIDKQNPV
ncbi:replication initiation protein, partial [Klebsiella pneumoniae]